MRKRKQILEKVKSPINQRLSRNINYVATF